MTTTPKKRIVGFLDVGKPTVMVWCGPHGHLLNPRTDLINHSPTGFAWGYSGSGPAQLAFAILVEVLGTSRLSEIQSGLYQRFKERVIASIRDDEWHLGEEQVLAVVEQIKEETAA